MSILRPLSRDTLTKQAADTLRRFILSEGLKVGDALPSERELSDILSVSRNIVREALTVLVAGEAEAERAAAGEQGAGNLGHRRKPQRPQRQVDKVHAQIHDAAAAGERHVIRFKTPTTGSTTVHDHLRGDITIENQHIDDYILVKSDGFALYHLAAMVDDHEMKITHVLRGSEWLPTFPLHVNIVRAFGW